MRTIKSSREVEAVFREGRRVAHPLVVALVKETPPERGPQGRVAFVAGKKIGGAVARNRAKRLLREAARIAGAPWEGLDAVLIARAATLEAPPSETARALSRIRAGEGR